MKKILFLSISILALTACKKNKIEKECCKEPHLELSVDSASIIAPNIFTPNGDGTNDWFVMKLENIFSIIITIYNKRDEIIWTESQIISNNNELYWDGVHTDGKWKGEKIDGNYKFIVDATTESGKHLYGTGEVGVVGDYSKRYCLKNISRCYFPTDVFGHPEQDVINYYCK